MAVWCGAAVTQEKAAALLDGRARCRETKAKVAKRRELKSVCEFHPNPPLAPGCFCGEDAKGPMKKGNSWKN